MEVKASPAVLKAIKERLKDKKYVPTREEVRITQDNSAYCTMKMNWAEEESYYNPSIKNNKAYADAIKAHDEAFEFYCKVANRRPRRKHPVRNKKPKSRK